ncbi:MAG: VOC family protein [Paracoccus sp. (in: a-proteobacteria)]|uniref:VOC family protein n=1 Tax=Paracoccus sp. TaxID=267 RepID=UPI0026DFD64F|nr:VOC family protein [Paracoccus sp. (in: a-proteobacteria)]MDO5620053.1 VOC family protein [Paracoccus sp. (in: a-proteobacteria)]
MTTGIHHITAITRNVQKNVDFWMGFLGLHLVKQTAGFEDGAQLHLFYGDAEGRPGTLVSFLVWQDGASGRVGLGQVSEISLTVPQETIGDWLSRALSAGVPVQGPAREAGETVLRLKDPDGITVRLVGADGPMRIHSATLLTDRPDETAAFVTRFGYRRAGQDGPVMRLESDTDAVLIRAAAGYVPGVPGTGIVDHVAFRAPDLDALRAMRLALKDHDGVTHVHDRKYFTSLYVREPGGVLIEYATDAPGMGVDEAPGHLGETLMIPPHDAARADDLRVQLPQFARPGEERMPMRDLPFIHRFHTPADPDGSTIVLLHGTGGDETDLMPLAARINPRAVLLGLRGRSTEEGINRWFRRFDAVTYDQADIRAESEAFAAFVKGAVSAYGLDAGRISFLGYSNGANLLAAAMRLHPGLIHRAILLRAVEALEAAPAVDLTGAQVLMLNGQNDPFARMAAPLENALRAGGAALDARTIAAGHELNGQDLTIAQDWLHGQDASGGDI